MSLSSTLSMEPVIAVWPAREVQAIRRIEPLQDSRWDRFIATHPHASVFHSSAWLQALSRTYGYKTFALSTSGADQELETAIVFCRIDSWLTGRRLVSLPFSDHCEPLLHPEVDPQIFAAAFEAELRREQSWYIEMRPLTPFEIRTPLHRVQVNYSFHHLDLSPDLETLFDNFHMNSIQRKIRRAEREGLVYTEGRSEDLLDSFYRLFQLTRQRHHLPPPPRAWFRNLVDCFGESLVVRVASKDGCPVAAMITLRHKDTMVYKYGCSDTRFNRFGGMHLLFWNAIQEAKRLGLQTLDFGRTDAGQSGLTTFKRRWGAVESTLVYSRYAASGSSTHVFDLPIASWKSRLAKRTLSHLPLGVLSLLGGALYKHVG